MYDEYDELDELLEEAYLEGYYDSMDDYDDYYMEEDNSFTFNHNTTHMDRADYLRASNDARKLSNDFAKERNKERKDRLKHLARYEKQEFREKCHEYEATLRSQRAKLKAKRSKNPEKIDPLIEDIERDLELLHDAQYDSHDTHNVIADIEYRMKKRNKKIAIIFGVSAAAVAGGTYLLKRDMTKYRKQRPSDADDNGGDFIDYLKWKRNNRKNKRND